MLAVLIDKAMERAVYCIIEGEGTYWGEIPELQGVWARLHHWKDVGVNCKIHSR